MKPYILKMYIANNETIKLIGIKVKWSTEPGESSLHLQIYSMLAKHLCLRECKIKKWKTKILKDLSHDGQSIISKQLNDKISNQGSYAIQKQIQSVLQAEWLLQVEPMISLHWIQTTMRNQSLASPNLQESTNNDG